jgi:hypothetical protein
LHDGVLEKIKEEQRYGSFIDGWERPDWVYFWPLASCLNMWFKCGKSLHNELTDSYFSSHRISSKCLVIIKR